MEKYGASSIDECESNLDQDMSERGHSWPYSDTMSDIMVSERPTVRSSQSVIHESDNEE